MSQSAPVIELEEIRRTYVMGEEEVHALAGVDLTVETGDYLAVMGPSGSGKSTLMNVIGCLDSPTSGSYLLQGIEVSNLADDRLAEIRNRRIGFIFQTFNLLPRADALANVELPLVYSGMPARERAERAEEVLVEVGLQDRIRHRPNEMSGGQRQRVAIARALVNRPALLLADEPTGNLDSKTGVEILGLFDKLKERGNTILLVTHEEELAARTGRIIRMKDGRMVDDQVAVSGPQATP
jgi:putative ABC transport system ATP-binding protein